MPLIPLFVQNELQAAAANRLSAFNFCDPFDHILPFSDGTIGKTDRAHLWGLYSGIEVAGELAAGTLPATRIVEDTAWRPKEDTHWTARASLLWRADGTPPWHIEEDQ